MKILLCRNYPSFCGKQLQTLIEKLPEFRRRKTLAYKQASSQAARALAYTMLSSELGYSPEFTYNKYGKPYIANNHISPLPHPDRKSVV
ncbi:MAG: hypothetical protein LBG74_01230 [Spirochaetaceae bacterium]|jgi:phosphopantetheinyl transferase|nr:hypothetical protein [Spirochaetaceae bacterium]